ncbi:MAG: hypothetical protein HY606_09930 [Planctomycetes bacterium]|nr:hypothetical protein [Planctomycetota bacterium]
MVKNSIRDSMRKLVEKPASKQVKRFKLSYKGAKYEIVCRVRVNNKIVAIS